jgi:hypothetical protein
MAKSELAYRSATFKRDDGSELDRLNRNLLTAAKVVDRYGDKYLSIFERIEQEIDRLERKTNVRDRIKALTSVPSTKTVEGAAHV